MNTTTFVSVSSQVFGEITVDPATIYTFPEGLPGLEEVTTFTLVTFTEYEPIIWMISIDGKYHFPMAPFSTLDPEDLDEESSTFFLPKLTSLLNHQGESIAYIIIRLDPSVTKISLKAPILVHPKTLEGKQYILDHHLQTTS